MFSQPPTSIRFISILILFTCLTNCVQSRQRYDKPGLRYHNESMHTQRSLTSSVSLSGDTQINTYTTGSQYYPALSPIKNGGFIITWQSNGQDGSGWGTYAQLFDANHAPVGGEFQVNVYTSNDQCNPDAAGLTNGKFVITYQDKTHDGNDWGVYMIIYNEDATVFLTDTRVNDYTSGDQSQPSITPLVNGGFVITWHSGGGQDGDGFGIYAKIFNADGTVLKSEFQVNTITSSDQMYPVISSFTDSSFVIAWQDSSSGNHNVRARMFTASGTGKAADFLVNTYTSDNQDSMWVATFSDNGFIIVWQSANQGGNPSGIYFQRYNADGTTAGSETQANTYTSNGQHNPNVATLANVGYIVAWESQGEDGSGNGVYAQRYFADGTKRGTEFRVNTYTSGDQALPYTKSYLSNSYVIAWNSYGQDGSDNGVFATIFLDCATNQYMYGQTCVSSCPTHYFVDTSRCSVCDSSCGGCSGSATSCTSCADGKYLTGSTCTGCDSSCGTCSGSATSCTGCPNGKYLSGSSCSSCDASCASCSGSATTCTACAGSTYLLDSKCVTDCGEGYVANSNTHKCEVPPKPSTQSTKSKTLAIAVSASVGSVLLIGFVGVIKAYYGAGRRRRERTVQKLQVKSNSVVPIEEAKINVAESPATAAVANR